VSTNGLLLEVGEGRVKEKINLEIKLVVDAARYDGIVFRAAEDRNDSGKSHRAAVQWLMIDGEFCV